MTTVAALRTRLRTVSGVIATSDNSSEMVFDNDTLDQVITDSLYEFDPTKTVSTLLTKEEWPLLLLCWANTHLMRAGRYSRYFAMQSPDGGGDKAEPLRHHLDMYETLRAKYVAAAEELGVGLGGGTAVTVGVITRVEKLQDTIVPATHDTTPDAVVISSATASSQAITLVWSESNEINFVCYKLYRYTASGLKDLSRLTASGAKYSGIIDAATEVTTIYDRWKTTYKDIGLTTGTTYYYVVMVMNKNSRVGISEEASAAAS